jgi:hypothetical protein
VAGFVAVLCGGCVLGEDASVDVSEVDDTRSGELEINGSPADDDILAEVQPDPDTNILFVRGGSKHDAVDVIITGRDGGVDYGSLINDAGATPLELYVALAGPSAAVPEELGRAHVLQARMTRGGDEQVRPPALAISAAAPGPWEIDNTIALSTFSCLSWPNFLEQLSNQFVGAPGRNQRSSWDDLGTHVLHSPDLGWTWDGGRTDIYVCNFNSAGSTPDSIRAELGHRTIDGDLHRFFATLADGWYARRLYGPTGGDNNNYYGRADPLPAGNSLLSFIGIVRRN